MAKNTGGLTFGPVPSRRLGLSLGVDLVPFKTCSYGCVYCQVGRTTALTIERKEYVPVDDVLDAIAEAMASKTKADHITLSGSGEPTLHSGIGGIIRGIKRMTKIPVAVLTNGSLLWMPDVRRDLADSDVVLPTLAAGDEAVFRAVHRPPPELTLDRVTEGMIAFRREHAGPIWLEVFLIRGVNTEPGQIAKMSGIAARIAPDRIQLNTAVRPTSEPDVRALSPEELDPIRRAFGAKTEVIADFKERESKAKGEARSGEILAMLARRPCTAEDVAAGLGLGADEAARLLAGLCRKRLAAREQRGKKQYFRAASR